MSTVLSTPAVLPDARLPAILALTALAAVSSVAAPLATYTLTLAVFGLPHVIQEMRYLRRRFGSSFGSAVWPVLGLLGVIAVGRLLGFLEVVGSPTLRLVELGAAAGLVLVVAPRWWRGAGRPLGLLVSIGLIAGLVTAPLATLLVVAVAHNWTPVPLLMDTSPSAAWRWTALIGFAAVPLLIVSGLPWIALSQVGWTAPGLDLLAVGGLQGQYGAYLPRAWHGASWAQHAFSAIVFAQCAHYIAVLGVLPGVQHTDGRSVLPGRWTVLVGIAVASALLFALYTVDFRATRSFYGVFSSMHAWVEVPVILLLLTGTPTRTLTARR